ncbi:MAG TPA: hypothetical protein VJ963_15445, partial [Bacteroidales bacterium]|nr:hypothetical protein [Bacteroidales bacterium]
MLRLLLLLFTWTVLGSSLFGQNTGDYRSKSDGNWGWYGRWERYNGSAWLDATSGQGYPGQYSVPGNVEIRNNVTLNIDPANNIGSLDINTGTLELSNHNLTVNGETNIVSSLIDSDPDGLIIFYGQINVAASATWNSSGSPTSHLLFYGNIVNNSNNVFIARARAAADIVLSGTGSMTLDYFEYNYDSYSITNQITVNINLGLNSNSTDGAQWINEGTLNYRSFDEVLMGSNGVLDASYTGNTVNYSGTGYQQVITPLSSYYNLSTSGSDTKDMVSNLLIAGDLLIGTSTTLNTNDYNITLAGNWTDQGSFSPGTGTVTFNGNTSQAITDASDETFYNLTLNNTGTTGNDNLILADDVYCTRTLRMQSGNIQTGSNVLTITRSNANSLNHTSGIIIGRLSRRVGSTGYNYLFPVGTDSWYRPAVYNFSNLGSTIYITSEFVASSPGAFTPYLDDGTDQLNYAFTDGYWSFSSSATPAVTYSLALDGSGFTSNTIDANSRISGRDAGSTAWDDPGGVNSSVTGSVITRTGLGILNTTSFDYCFAGRCTINANAGPDVSICKGSSVTLNGSGGDTYSWSPATGLSNPNIQDPLASPSVTTTYTLTATRGSCISTDQVTVTVNQVPAAVLGYAYQKILTIDGSRVVGTNNDFPVLIHLTDNDIKNHVLNANGYDIIFTDT